VASFVVDASGEFVPTDMSAKILDSNKVVAVIDEPSRKIFLWLGSGSTLNNRMGAKRAVKPIPTFGLRVKGAEFPIGRDCKIIEVDEATAGSDENTRASLSELEALLKKPHRKQGEGIWYVEDFATESKGETRTEAKILERRIQFEMSHLEKETIAKHSKRRTEENKK
jgi:hypothetical protein